jgi:hypothetical protein
MFRLELDKPLVGLNKNKSAYSEVCNKYGFPRGSRDAGEDCDDVHVWKKRNF